MIRTILVTLSGLGALSSFRKARARKATFRAQAEEDAADLVRRYGRYAYYIARENARDERQSDVGADVFPPGHWARVRQALRVMLGRDIGENGAVFTKPDPLPGGHPRARWRNL